ncbi:MAG: UDP-N-acetylmuramoyl-tripeptide--D-alanyl-D-alanine ligase [Proteobacteria bacterium]|nr:UDP-N-acetylmuramoyl-tripeptide--D-alanyl-D-alanine ligase [Pseudomonadota bacterium]
MAVNLIFSWKRLQQYLKFFQQEEYDNKRFINWYFANTTFDKKISLFCVLLLGVNLVYPLSLVVAAISFSLYALWLVFSEKNPTKFGKIKLKLTERAKRIYGLAFLLYLVLQIIWLSKLSLNPFNFLITQIFLFQILPFSLLLAKSLLQFDEDRRQRKFMQEAKDKLAKINPYVVGITGSYGKSTTKGILAKLMELSLGPTFWPPKSINTPMGITREIRENMKDFHKYAIIEMGAYGIGSIKRLCDLTPPQAGIVTVVGVAHLERYKTEEAILKAKSELAQAIPADGVLVCNADNAGTRKIAELCPKKQTLFYSLENKEVDCFADNIEFLESGTKFSIHYQSKVYSAFTRIHGRPAVSNILAAFTLCCGLGANPEVVIAAMGNIEPYNNRLEVVRLGGGLQINDAYNSNPLGFKAALEVLQQLKGARKILMTPGMIELGERQYSENFEVAKYAASICDTVVIVGLTNREALEKGCIAGGLSAGKVLYAINREEAFSIIAKIRTADDILLIENDLPDLYEVDVKF